MKMKRTILAVLLAVGLVFSLAAQNQVNYLIVNGIVGTSYYKYPDQPRVQISNTGLRLYSGVKITTGAGGQLRLSFPGDAGSQILLQGGTTVEVSKLITQGAAYSSSISLRAGRMRAVVGKIFGTDFDIRTKSAVAGVRGTDYGVGVTPGADDTVYVFGGKVAVQGVMDGGGLSEPSLLGQGDKIGVRLGGLLTPLMRISRDDAGLFRVNYKDLFPGGDGKKDDGKKDDGTKDDGKKDDGTKDDGTKNDGKKDDVKKDDVKKDDPTPTYSGGRTDSSGPVSRTGSSGSTGSSSTGPSWLGGAIGPEVIGDKTWTKMILAPKISAGKFKIQLYLPVIYDANEPLWETSRWYNHDEWDFKDWKDAIHDVLIKIMYVQYGKKDDKVFIRLGNIEDFIVGHGFLMNHYNNAVSYPSVKRVGGQLDLSFKRFGFESMIGDIYRAEIFGGRFYVRPFKKLFKSFAIGVSYINDINPTDAVVTNDNSLIAMTGVDAEIRLPSLGILTWKVFADYGKMAYKSPTHEFGFHKGYGWTYGVMGRLLFFQYKLGYRHLRDGFIPEYFDSNYEFTRGQKFAALMSSLAENYNGWIFEMGLNIEKVGFVKVNFQTYEGIPTGSAIPENKLYFILNLNKGVIPKFHFSFEYERYNIESFEKFFDGIFGTSITTIKLYYEVGAGVEIVGTYRRFYDELGGYTDNYGVQTQIGF